MLNGLPVTDYLAFNLMEFYKTCKIGTGGMSFNWPSGCWEDTPRIIVEAFDIIDRCINEHLEKESQDRQREMQRKMR